MVTLDFGAVSVALPSVRAGLGLSAEEFSLVPSGFALSFGGFMLVGGRAADLYGRARLFATGLGGMTLGSTACAVAPNLEVLLAARVLQGIAGALMVPAAISYVTSATPEGPARERALGVYAGLGSAGFLLGTTAGGAAASFLGWRAPFFLSVPLGIFATHQALHLVAADQESGPAERIPLVSAVAATGALVTLAWSLTQLGAVGWSSPRAIGGFLVATVLTGGFARAERRSSRPMVPLADLRHGALGRACLVASLLVGSASGAIFLTTRLLQEGMGYSPAKAGMALGVLGVAAVCGGLSAPILTTRFGVPPVLGMAILVQAAATLLVATSAEKTGPLILAIAGVGFGFTAAIVAFTELAAASTGPGHQGIASGLLNAAQQVGAGVGVASVAMAVASYDSAPPNEGVGALGLGFLIAAGACVIALLIVVTTAGRSRRPEELQPGNVGDQQ